MGQVAASHRAKHGSPIPWGFCSFLNQRLRELFGVEGLQLVRLFAKTDELERDSNQRRKVEFKSGQNFRADFPLVRGAGYQLVAALLK